MVLVFQIGLDTPKPVIGWRKWFMSGRWRWRERVIGGRWETRQTDILARVLGISARFVFSEIEREFTGEQGCVEYLSGTTQKKK